MKTPHLNIAFIFAALGLIQASISTSATFGQILAAPPVPDKISHLETPTDQAHAKEQALINRIYEPELLLRVEPSQSKIIRTNYLLQRTAISNPDIVNIQVFGENEIEIIGLQPGETTMTFWFDIPELGTQVLRYLVVVDSAQQQRREREARHRELQSRVNELFPNSQVFLFPVDDKVIVRGQARDSKEAAAIMVVLGQNQNGYGRGFNGQFSGSPFYSGFGGFGDAGNGDSAQPNQNRSNANGNFINMLHVPGEQQVMLKVRIAELVRDSNRGSGFDFELLFDDFSVSNLVSGGGNLTAILEDGDVQFFLRALATHGYGKVLAEPTLVTISGKTARFLAGGEFAVPTSVGLGGIGAASTTFRGFGTELQFTPTVMDKDLVRIEVSPSFSSLNADATVGGIPGLNRRSVDTTVDLREGQWLAIAGLIQDEQGGQRTRVPYLGDLPFLGGLFSSQDTSRFETELIVLVSPQLVHPMEEDQVPPLLPGMEVTEPTDDDFFIRNTIEGYSGFDHRSTVWPEVQRQQNGVNRSNIRPGAGRVSGRLRGRMRRFINAQNAYVCGYSGFSE